MIVHKWIAVLSIAALSAKGQPDSTNNFHVGLVYPLSSNGQYAQRYANNVSFHLLGGVSRSENAFCFSGVTNLVTENAKGFVFAGVVNHIGGDFEGYIFSGCSNIHSGVVHGCQIAGFNNIVRQFKGVQCSGFSNIARTNAGGVQVAGFSNLVSDTIEGMQVAGFSNIARFAQYQFAGFSNVSSCISGIQAAGFANVAQDVRGVQAAGFINVAKKVKGAQIAGFINIADSCEYPIALVNFIANGDKSLGVSIDEMGTSLLTLRSGSKKLYGILGVGVNDHFNKMQYGLEGGMGARFPFNLFLYFNAEASVITLSDFRNGAFMKSSLRFFPSLRVARHFELFGGPTFNFINTPQLLLPQSSISYVWSRFSKGTFYGLNIGGIAGIQYHF